MTRLLCSLFILQTNFRVLAYLKVRMSTASVTAIAVPHLFLRGELCVSVVFIPDP